MAFRQTFVVLAEVAAAAKTAATKVPKSSKKAIKKVPFDMKEETVELLKRMRILPLLSTAV